MTAAEWWWPEDAWPDEEPPEPLTVEEALLLEAADEQDRLADLGAYGPPDPRW